MSRARKADHNSVIDAAQSVFWQHGYHGTSTRQIEQSTGLTRFTLQTSYGGKKTFFLQTLDAYLDRAEADFLPDPDSTNLETLALWVEGRSDPAVMPMLGAKGCLLLNSITEFDRDGGEVDDRISRYFDVLQGRLEKILTRAVSSGEVDQDLDPEEKARLLVSLLLGLTMTIKARPSDDFATPYTAAAAAMIRQWRVVT
jgi:TetR/AcrR family transcriptional repressor of nem operon